jgi:hypothetical protein
MVLDGIYSSLGGPHLTPYSGKQLRKAQETSTEKYNEYRAFNAILSGQRVTIERAFGMLIRRWGILWKPLEYRVHDIVLISRICAKLHNMCTTAFMAKKSTNEDPQPHSKDSQLLFSVPNYSIGDGDIDFPNDDIVANRLLTNSIVADEHRSVDNEKREYLRLLMKKEGLTFSSEADYFIRLTNTT